MLRNPRLLIIAASSAIAAILGLGGWALMREPSAPSRRLADGSLLRLEDVTFGREHYVFQRKWWQTILSPVLPLGLRGRIAHTHLTPDSDTLVFHLSKPSSAAMPGPFRWSGRGETIDEHGCRVGEGATYGFSLAVGSIRNRMLTSGALYEFPRRARTFTLRLYERDHVRPIAEFPIRNPLPGPYPTWRPEPLGAPKRRGDLEVRLTALTTGLPWRRVEQSQPAPSKDDLKQYRRFRVNDHEDHPATPMPDEVPWTRVSLRIQEKGGPPENWEPDLVQVSDATGNALVYRPMFDFIRSEIDRSGNMWLAFPSVLCSREPAWKVQTRFSYIGPRDDTQGDARWTLRDVPMPEPGHMLRSTAGGRQHGLTLGLVGIARGVKLDGWPWEAGRPIVQVDIAHPPDQNVELAMRTLGEDRRPVVRIPFSRRIGEEVDTYFVRLEIPRGARKMDLTFVGWKSRAFEFLARPEPPQVRPQAESTRRARGVSQNSVWTVKPRRS